MPKKSSTAETGNRTRGIDRAFEILDHLHEAKRPLRPNASAARKARSPASVP